MNSSLKLHSDLHAPLNESQRDSQHTHLTESQIDDLLIGDLASAPAAHLAACSLCTERAAAAANSIASFQDVSMAWSERRSATLPIPDLSQQRPLWQRPIVSFAVCFSFVLGITLTNATQQFPLRSAAPQPVLQETAHSGAAQQALVPPLVPVETSTIALQRDAQLSADNHMLHAIDADLDASSDSAAELGIVTTGELAGRSPTISSVQD